MRESLKVLLTYILIYAFAGIFGYLIVVHSIWWLMAVLVILLWYGFP